MGGEGGAVAEQDRQELEPAHVPAENHEADRQRHRQHQTHTAPEEGPDCGGEHDGERREAGAPAVEQGLDHMADQRLDDQEEGGGPDEHCPGRIDREGDEQRRRDAHDGADVGHVAQHAGENAPQERARQADEHQPDADHSAESGVHRKLREEQPPEPLAGVVERGGGALQVLGADEADDAVAEVLALREREGRDPARPPRRASAHG